MSFIREVFSENNQGSFSRVCSAFHVAAAISWITHFVLHTHGLPDAATVAGLTAFATAPYGANKLGNAISSFGNAGEGKGSKV